MSESTATASARPPPIEAITSARRSSEPGIRRRLERLQPVCSARSRVRRVREEVHPEAPAPDDEAHLVQVEHEVRAVAGEEQDHPRREDGDRGDHEQGREQAQHQRRRSLLPVDPGAGVVAGEAVAGAAELEQHRRDQRHPDEHVRAQQVADQDDRDPLRDQEEREHDRGRAGEDLVALGAPETVGSRAHRRQRDLPLVNGRQRALAAARPRAPRRPTCEGVSSPKSPCDSSSGPAVNSSVCVRADDAVAELQRPQPVDRDRPAVLVAQGAEEAAVERVVGVDAPVAEVADQQRAARGAEALGRRRDAPRRVERSARGRSGAAGSRPCRRRRRSPCRDRRPRPRRRRPAWRR